jgi:hypothetical protein
MKPRAALDAIHACMDGTEWTPGTFDQIADILRESGYVIRDPGELPDSENTP